jgi:2-iminobutanoate/2-iminopropanoate deaminase
MPMDHEPVLSPDMPRALGPYSQVVRAGSLLFVSGQAGLDPATGAPAGDTFEAQARQAFQNLSTALEAAGSSLAHVVKTTIFCADAGAFATLNQLYAEFFPHNPPARSVPIVQLPRGLLVSIECIAVALGREAPEI